MGAAMIGSPEYRLLRSAGVVGSTDRLADEFNWEWVFFFRSLTSNSQNSKATASPSGH